MICLIFLSSHHDNDFKFVQNYFKRAFSDKVIQFKFES